MKRLEDIPKQHPFTVPDKYFDELPNVLQSRMARKRTETTFSLALKYALPAMAALVVAGIFWFKPEPAMQTALSEIETEQIAYYLDESGLMADDDQDPSLTSEELEQLELDVFSNMELNGTSDENILEGIDLDNI